MKTFPFLFLLGIPFLLTVSAFAIEEDDATLTKRELVFLEKLKYFPPDNEKPLEDQIKSRITKDKPERLKEKREYLLSLFQKHTTEIHDAANPASRLKSGEDSERVRSLANALQFSDDIVAKASSEAETQIESEDKELEEVLSYSDDDKDMDTLLPHLLDRSGALKKNTLNIPRLIKRSRLALANEKRNHPQQEIDDDKRMIELFLEFGLPEPPVRDAMADARKIVNLSNAVLHQKNLALAKLLVEDAKLEKHIRRRIISVAVKHGNSDALQMLIEPSESVRDKIFALEIALLRRRLYRRVPSLKPANNPLAENIYAIVVSLLEDIPPRKAKKLADKYEDKDLLKELKRRAGLSCKDKVINTVVAVHLMCRILKHIP